MAKEIKHSFFFPHPIEVVWDYLTKPELVAQWLMENDIKPVVGHEFQFRSKPVPAIEFDGIVYCKILEVQPPQQLSYTWNCSPADIGYKINTVVQWNLVPKDNGTELLLHQTGFKEQDNEAFYQAMHGGWVKQIEKLTVNLNAIVK